ncbi:MAG: transglycosylase SLT domain-containing protein [Thermodesulfovibrionales bacterium]|jgi:membrane-bound lytic murein transglycosylase D
MRDVRTSLRGCFLGRNYLSFISFFVFIISFTLPAYAGGVKEQTQIRAEGLISPGEGISFPMQEGENSIEQAGHGLVITSPDYERERAVISNLPEASGQKAPLGISYESNESAVRAIDKNLFFFKDRIKERFSLWLERSARYVEIMKGILNEKGLPEDLVFLPIVESGFNLNAYSRAAAVGPWQFISGTAKRYGLVVDWWRDERRDPIKSTNAAAEYLKDLYGMFGSWKLALAAYNAGEGRILRALKKTGTEDYWALMETKQLHSETNEYVPKYIAASLIATAPEEYGFSNLVYHKPMEYDEILIQSPLDIEVIARCAETSIEEIRGLNPELKRWSTPLNVSRYTVRIPEGTKDIFIENLSRIPKSEWFTVGSYKVEKGESLKKISRKSGVPVSAIVAMNSLGSARNLPAGTVLKLPPMEKFHPDRDDKGEKKKLKTASLKKGSKDRSAKLSGKKNRSGKIVKVKGRGKSSSLRSAKKSKKTITTRVSHKLKKAKHKAKNI